MFLVGTTTVNGQETTNNGETSVVMMSSSFKDIFKEIKNEDSKNVTLLTSQVIKTGDIVSDSEFVREFNEKIELKLSDIYLLVLSTKKKPYFENSGNLSLTQMNIFHVKDEAGILRIIFLKLYPAGWQFSTRPSSIAWVGGTKIFYKK